jgi:glycosyltransferase involved in cell wall biosynthesis
MMQIVMLLSNAFRPDPRVLKEAQILVEAGFDITIICWDRLSEYPSKEILSSGVKIIRIQNVISAYGVGARQIFYLLRFWYAAYHLLAGLKPNLIHCHDFDTLPCGLVWSKLHCIPIIYDAHEYYAELVRPRLSGLSGKLIYFIIRNTEKYAAKLCSAVITVDETLLKFYSQFNKNILVIGHYPRKHLADTYNPIFNRSELILLYSGRISVDRGSLLYIELLRDLIGLNIPTRLLFAGIFTPAIEEELIIQHSNNIENSIDYLGWIPYQQMQAIYRSADIGLCILQPEPRYIAAVPVKLFEYMASGLPVIASNFPAISSIIFETKCGIVVDPLSQPSIIAEIIKNWWISPSIPRSIGENGRLAVLSKYNWENQSEKLSMVYHRFLDITE